VVRFGSLPSKEEISDRAPDVFPQSADQRQSFITTAIHPYVGYVHMPLSTPRTPMAVESVAISFGEGNELSIVPGPLSTAPQPRANRWGYLDSEGPLRRRASGKVIVGILGGSVAECFSVEGADKLAAELRKIDRFANKEIEFVRLAVQGHKQPQQLLTLTYLLSIGAEFDVVINIDGFNELFISIFENYERGVVPTYPMEWDLRVQTAGAEIDPLILGRLAVVQHERTATADFFVRFPWRNSSIARTAWLYSSSRYAQRQADLLKDLANRPESKHEIGNEAVSGPFEKIAEDDLYEQCVEVWRRSSLQLHKLCESHGIVYYHFLQPNQYVPGSKPMNEEERARAITLDTPFDRVIRKGYPLLEIAGRELTSQGVRFHSLTDVFHEHEEPLYKDNCCHLNKAGSDVIAVEVARFIGEKN
jgi:hypothetical protein